MFLPSGGPSPDPDEMGTLATGVCGLIGPSLVGVLALLVTPGNCLPLPKDGDTGNDIMLALVGITGDPSVVEIPNPAPALAGP